MKHSPQQGSFEAFSSAVELEDAEIKQLNGTSTTLQNVTETTTGVTDTIFSHVPVPGFHPGFISQLGSFLSAVIFGHIVKATHSYDLPLILLALFMLFGAVM
jgi:hypothetical protein